VWRLLWMSWKVEASIGHLDSSMTAAGIIRLR